MVKGVLLIIASLAVTFTAPCFAHEGHSEKTTLETDMQAIATTYEKLGKQIEDKNKNQASAKLTQELIDKSMNAQKHTPPGAEKLKGEEQTKVVGKYKADMQTMIDHLNKMKVALLANNNTEAKTHFEALKPWTTPTHGSKY